MKFPGGKLPKGDGPPVATTRGAARFLGSVAWSETFQRPKTLALSLASRPRGQGPAASQAPRSIRTSSCYFIDVLSFVDIPPEANSV